MGYTHYYTIKSSYLKEEASLDLKVPEIAEDIRALVLASELPIGNAMGDRDSDPMLGPEAIGFNGIGDDRYESFNYPPSFNLNRDAGITEGFGFTKTQYRPYDVVVTASLIAVKHHMGDLVDVASDGDFDNAEEWGPAYHLYQRALHRDLPLFFQEHAKLVRA